MVHLYAAAATTVGQLKTHCPHCGRDQIVLQSDPKNPARCKSCGVLLPAKVAEERENYRKRKA